MQTSPQATYDSIAALTATLARIGAPYQWALVVAAVALALVALVPRARAWRRRALVAVALLLVAGEGALMWFHYRLWQLTAVTDPATGALAGHVAVPLWVESEKLFVWALILAVLGSLMRRHRDELLTGTMLITSVLVAGAALWGKPFTAPVPSFMSQYTGYLQAMATAATDPNQMGAAYGQFQGMVGSMQGYYNAWYMWVHPPLLFLSYGAFALSFLATIVMIRKKHSAYETTSYRWARWGYLPLTFGMLIGFPWALMAWDAGSWWWSGKVNMSMMMWVLYTAYLHARLYLRRRGMWRAVAVLSVLSFLILVLTYITTYVVPGAHSYAAAGAPAIAAGPAGVVAALRPFGQSLAALLPKGGAL